MLPSTLTSKNASNLAARKKASQCSLEVTTAVLNPFEVILAVTYPPAASMRKGHAWRIVAPTTWGLAKFIVSLLSGLCLVSAGQVAKFTVEKTYGARALTVITIKSLEG
jgi:hypothetical protein